jgi:hypothetical protein
MIYSVDGAKMIYRNIALGWDVIYGVYDDDA